MENGVKFDQEVAKISRTRINKNHPKIHPKSSSKSPHLKKASLKTHHYTQYTVDNIVVEDYVVF